MKTVLVTGAAGFIGRQCLPLLAAAGYTVHAATSRPLQAGLYGANWHQADLLDYAQAGGLIARLRPTHLLHLAWYVAPGSYHSSVENLRWCQATIELARLFAEHGGRRAAVAGTCFEYDQRFGYCSEDLTPPRPSTLYAASKDASRQILASFSRQAGFTLAWGRIFHLYGPHEPPARLVPSVITSLMSRQRARCSHGGQVRDFMHVEDVARAFVAILGSGIEGPVNIGSGQPATIRSIVNRIAARLDACGLVDFGAIEASPGDPPVLLPDVGKLHGEVGWAPRWTLDDGLADTIQWWRKHLDAAS